MIKFENTEVLGWEHAVRGMRNPLNSWAKSDSEWKGEYLGSDPFAETVFYEYQKNYEIGPNDLDLMKRLRNAGTDHRKFMRMITVYVDILAPLYWWKEFDTYKVGTVANSCSTMHTIHKKEFSLDDFSHEHVISSRVYDLLSDIVNELNDRRALYLDTKDKEYWWQMIQLLPTSYNQKRTVMLNYEVLANIYKSRRDHKLDEWHEFCDWIRGLPHSELITGECETMMPPDEVLDQLVEAIAEIDPRIAKWEHSRVQEWKDTNVVNFFDENGVLYYAFDMEKLTIQDVLESVKEAVKRYLALGA